MKPQTLSTRLTRMNLLVSGAVLLLAAVAFFSYDLLSFRQDLIRNLEAEAEIVGENSVSALTFNDRDSAAATLRSLRSSPDIRAAALVDNNGKVFAGFGTSGLIEPESRRLEADETDHIWSGRMEVLVAHRIVFQGKPVGVVYISARLRQIALRARQYLFIAAIILMFCMVAGLLISAAARRLIARPIIALADTALRISRDQDYAVRAAIVEDSSEISVLTDAFNTMLTQIQERDEALKQARAELEARVEERTAELQTANRELEAFSYTVAHDLRGPLDSISGIVFLLQQSWGKSDLETVQPMLDQLRTSSANMGSLIDDLLKFARASNSPITLTPVDISAIAREIAAELSASDAGRNVEFVIADLPEVLADDGLVRIVLDNLLRNSWKYTSHHAKACIEFGAKLTTPPNDTTSQLVYFVRDDGAGFDPARMDLLFKPFRRLHLKSEFPGTGIGLSTVQRIVARHGGCIWAEGSVEKGATFYFTLKADQSQGQLT
jgi:signal transduction histidine kinase